MIKYNPQLLIERFDSSLVKTSIIDSKDTVVLESTNSGVVPSSSGPKYYLEGPVIGAEVRNRNKRLYPLPIIEREVDAYQDVIARKKSCGTFMHDVTPQLIDERISHVFESLYMDGNIGYGKARILPALPYGKIAVGFILEGLPLGFSTRGCGSLSSDNIVQDDFKMISLDIVFEPSFEGSVMQPKVLEAVMESTHFKEVPQLNQFRKTVHEKYSFKGSEANKKLLEEATKQILSTLTFKI